MPPFSRSSFGIVEWVVEAGWVRSERTAPRLTAWAIVFTPSSTRRPAASAFVSPLAPPAGPETRHQPQDLGLGEVPAQRLRAQAPGERVALAGVGRAVQRQHAGTGDARGGEPGVVHGE